LNDCVFVCGKSQSEYGYVSRQAKQAALRQQMQVQQRQEVLRLLSTLTPEQREQLSRLPPAAQVHTTSAHPAT